MSGAGNSVGAVETHVVRIPLPEEGLRLAAGGVLHELQVAYEAYGELAPAKDNVIFVCHAISGDAHVAGYHASQDADAAGQAPGKAAIGWWDEMIGPGKGIDTGYYHVICANILGGCKGTTGPSSTDPKTGKPYGSTFPAIGVLDVVNVHRLLLEHLGIERLAAVVGGSFGGMQALEWAISYPDTIDRCICIASAASLSTQALAFDVVGRNAITSDPGWQGGDYYGTGRAPDNGLSQARKIGHITYLSADMMARKFGREKRGEAKQPDFRSDFQVESYLEHQGQKFLGRFDANSYLHITRAMDEFDLGERFGSLEAAFASIGAQMLIVALSEDWLFRSQQSVEIANGLVRAGKRVSYCGLHAPHGHDAFLVDIQHLSDVIRAFMPWVDKQDAPVDDGITGPAGAPQTVAPKRKSRCRLKIEGCRCFREAPLAGSDQRGPDARRQEFELTLRMIRDGARVLDLGCGDGELLSLLGRERQVAGTGLDFDIQHVINVIDRGHDVFQADIDAGLAMIPDGTYDYAVLGETLQVVRRPQFVLKEMLRVAEQGVVSFPNFANWSHRLHLATRGRMPKSNSLPFEWYNTPNIHLFTLKDFVNLCEQDGIRILDLVCVPASRVDRILLRAGFCNLGAEKVLVKVARA